MELLPLEVVSAEILARCAEYAPALRAVCRAWHVALLPQRASRGEGLAFLALGGHADLLRWVRALCTARGAPWTRLQLDSMLWAAADGGHEALCVLVKEWGAGDFDGMLRNAALGGHKALCRLAKEWGAGDYNGMLRGAAYSGHEPLCRLAKEWGATNFDGMLRSAIASDKEAIRLLAVEWKAAQAVS